MSEKPQVYGVVAKVVGFSDHEQAELFRNNLQIILNKSAEVMEESLTVQVTIKNKNEI